MKSSRHFENWLRAYAEYTEHSEAPREFHFWTGVATIAGALRRQVWIEQRYFQWTPNFYIILIGPPGVVTKSTSMRVGLELLRGLDTVHMGPQSMTWQGLSLSLEEAKDLVPNGEDFLPMSCITCDVSELGTFLQPSDDKLVSFLIDMWDGQIGQWEHKLRTTEGAKIQNAWINVISCTTPSWIKKNIPEEMVSGGLFSRIIFVHGDKKRHLVPYPADVIESKTFLKRKERLTDDLHQIGAMVGEFTLTTEAKKWGSIWYEKHWGTRPEHMASDRFEGYIGRKQTHMHKLAMVLAAAESSKLVIEQHHLKTAQDMLVGIERDMLRVFEMVGTTAESQKMDALMNFIRIYKSIEKRQLWRLCMRIMSQKEFVEAIEAAVSAGMLGIYQTKDGYIYKLKGD